MDRAAVLPAEQQAGVGMARAELGSLAAQHLGMRTEQRQAAPLRDAGPGVGARLSLGRPARRTPGHIRALRRSVRLTRYADQAAGAVFLALHCPARGYRV